MRWTVFSCVAAALAASACGDPAGERLAAAKAYAEAAAAYDSGDFETARVMAADVVSECPGLKPAAVLEGKAAFLLGDLGGAVSALEVAAREAAVPPEAGLWLARAYRAAGRGSDARSLVERMLSDDPRSVAGLRAASALALDEGRLAEAAALLDLAVEGASEAGMALLDRASLRWAGGQYAGARDDVEAAMAVIPRASSAYGAAAELLGRLKEARP